MPWVVFASPPKNILTSRWDFATDYFPKLYHYKKDAEVRAREANLKGGTAVVINEKDVDVKKVNTHYIVRCDRDMHVFSVIPHTDVRGEKVITCPKCGRGYYRNEEGVWESDRPLKILSDPTHRLRRHNPEDQMPNAECPVVSHQLDAMQIASVNLLGAAEVMVKDEGGKLIYTIMHNGRETVEAEYIASTRTLCWIGGNTTRQQDQCIRIHAELSLRR